MIVKEHEALAGLPKEFPNVLGYNKTIAKPEADVVATVEGDPDVYKRQDRGCTVLQRLPAE